MYESDKKVSGHLKLYLKNALTNVIYNNIYILQMQINAVH